MQGGSRPPNCRTSSSMNGNPKRLLAALLVVGLIGATPNQSSEANPNKVRIVTSDIPNYWRAFDDAAKQRSEGSRANVFGKEYFLPGSDGLWAFVGGRLRSPRYVARVAAAQRADYAAVRRATERMPSVIPAVRADFVRFKNFYPGALFPTIFFVIGTWNSGGTSVPGVGDIMGAEVLAKKGIAAVPGVVIHETIHYNQRNADENTVNDYVLNEGSADFLAELANGPVETDETWRFGCAHEDALWAQFSHDSKKRDEATINGWVFSSSAPLGAPPFIGYWLGYRIVQTYYVNATNKKSAINDILHMQDYSAFLTTSGYPQKRPACQRITRWPS